MDQLAKDPRVAESYGLWYEMREEVLHTYKNDLPERLPLSRQKEFKQIKNLVIREAVRLGENLEWSDAEDGLDRTASDPTGSSDAVEDRHTQENRSTRRMDDFRRQLLADCVIRLLHHMANLFREQAPRQSVGSIRFTDKKLRRKIRERKIALGHKPDDHEDQGITPQL